MINPNWRANEGAASVSIGGVVVGEMQTMAYKAEPKELGEYRVPKLEGSFTVKDTTADWSKFMAHLMEPPACAVIIREEFKTEPRNLRSKKRRLRKKWAKKYPHKVVEKRYEDVRIEL